MKQLLQIRTSSKYLLFASATTALLLLSACQMIIDPALLEVQPTAMATETPSEEAVTEETAMEDAVAAEEVATEEVVTEETVTEEATVPEVAATEEAVTEEPVTEDAAATEETASGETAEEVASTEEAATEETVMEETAATEDATTDEVLVEAEPVEEPATEEVTETAPSNNAASSAPIIPGVEPAKATVNIPALRVHEEPSDSSEMIASITEGESFRVKGISSTGIWIELELPDMPAGSGWVSANFVTLEGDITNIAIIPVAVDASTDAATTVDDASAEVTSTEGSTADATTAETTLIDGPSATINTRSLRVRDTPDADSEVITGVREGETYRVLEVSADGAWVKLEIPRAPNGVGWVAAEFVDMQDDTQDSMESVATETETEAEAADSDTPTEEAAADEPVAEQVVDPAVDPAVEPAIQVDAGFALVSSDLPLRVRSAPTTEVENKVGNVFDGEIYRILEVSEDGFWVRIDAPQLELEDGGWVSAEYLILGTE